MAKMKDITDKLTFDENPCLIVKGVELEVNSDAPTMLKVMGIMGSEEVSMDGILKASNLIFPEETRKKLDDLKLTFPDLMIVIEEAVSLITGEEAAREQ